MLYDIPRGTKWLQFSFYNVSSIIYDLYEKCAQKAFPTLRVCEGPDGRCVFTGLNRNKRQGECGCKNK